MRWFISWALVLSPVLALAADVPFYRWTRHVQLPELTETSLVSASLDSHFFQNTLDLRVDLRLRDDRGAPVGFLVRQTSEPNSRIERQAWRARQTAAKVDMTTGLQIELKLKDTEEAPHGMRIITPLRDFEHQVKVETSPDGKTWMPHGAPTLIFDYSRYVDARNDIVSIEPTKDRHFRVIIEDVTADQSSELVELNRRLRGGVEEERTERTNVDRRPFRVDMIQFYRDVPVAAGIKETRRNTYAATDLSIQEDTKKLRTVVSFQSQKEPINRITIATTTENFSRQATIEVEEIDRDGKSNWRQIGQGTVTRFAIGTIRRESLSLELAETSATKYRVLIENQDSSPLSITGVEISGPAYELAFLASPGQKLELDYGSPDAKAARFDTAALEAAIKQSQQSLSAQLGLPQQNPNAPARATETWKPWNDSRVLTIGMIVLTAALGFGLYHASRRL